MRLSVWHWALILVLVIVAPAAGWWVGQRAISDTPSSDTAPAAAIVNPEYDGTTSPPHSAPRSTSTSNSEPGGKQGEVVSSWSTMDQAVAESKSNGKPVLIDFNAEWCPPCRLLKRDLFDHPTMGRSVQTAVIPVSIVDRRRETGMNTTEVEDLQRRYSIEAFPTLVMYSPASGRYEKLRGYAGAQQTLAWINETALSLR